MKRLIFALALIFTVCLSPVRAEHNRTVVFEGTLVRLDSWGLAKINCGAAIVYRLAEYKVEVAHYGKLQPGELLTIKHLACNYSELNDLKVGDKVIVVASVLKKPEKTAWQPKLPDNFPAAITKPASGQTVEIPIPAGEPVIVRYNAQEVANLIYPE